MSKKKSGGKNSQQEIILGPYKLEPETSPNDRIDIYGTPDINVKKIKGRTDTEFRVEISGNNIDNSISNAIRRTILMNIPVYGFHRSNIYIDPEKTHLMYNNDMIYNQIETLPIYDIPNNFDLENPEIFLSNEILRKTFGDFVQERQSIEIDKTEFNKNKKLVKIEMVIDMKNTTGTDHFVSTHDAVIKIDNKISDGYTKRPPICMLVLKPGEELSLRAEANLGISSMSGIYEATTNAIHIEHNPAKYEIVYETLEQLDKNIIFIKACTILAKKLEHLRKFIKNKYPEEPEKMEFMEIQLYGEDDTLGNLIATALQKCKFVLKAAYNIPHPLNKLVVIQYWMEKNSKVGQIKLFEDVLDYLIRVFKMILDNVSKKKE